jgi:uncharacterized protein (DUF1330 family)
MAEAYWIGRIDVHNPDGYQHYAAAHPAIIKKFGRTVCGAQWQVRGR